MAEQKLIPAPLSRVDLAAFDPEDTNGYDKERARSEMERLGKRLGELQEILYAQGKYALLCVFQGMDTAGKDGVIKKVFDHVNPQGIKVAAFKVPTPDELARDFLWRIHAQVPPKGYIGIFNRSHYEDVLIVRVNELVTKDVWSARYDHINEFEKLLAENGTRIVKFYLHISKAEQKQRLQARLDDPSKHWKFSLGDLPVRERWDDYMSAYADALSLCNTEYAPWVIVPANKKWYRDLVVTRTLVEIMEGMPLRYPTPKDDLSKVVIPD